MGNFGFHMPQLFANAFCTRLRSFQRFRFLGNSPFAFRHGVEPRCNSGPISLRKKQKNEDNNREQKLTVLESNYRPKLQHSYFLETAAKIVDALPPRLSLNLGLRNTLQRLLVQIQIVPKQQLFLAPFIKGQADAQSQKPKKNPKHYIHALYLSLAALSFNPAAAYHLGETLKFTTGGVQITGSYSQGLCALQANRRAQSGAPTAFALQWKPGKSLFLIVAPGRTGQNRETFTFAFSDGSAHSYTFKKSGKQYNSSLGFGGKTQSLWKSMRASDAMRIDMPGLGDSVTVNLQPRDDVLARMVYCKEKFLHK